jgi:hypothetical protein
MCVGQAGSPSAPAAMKQTVTTVGLMIENQIIENILIGGGKSRKLTLPQFSLYFKTLRFENFLLPRACHDLPPADKRRRDTQGV